MTFASKEKDKKNQLLTTTGTMTTDIIREREELSEQIRALEDLKKMAAAVQIEAEQVNNIAVSFGCSLSLLTSIFLFIIDYSLILSVSIHHLPI